MVEESPPTKRYRTETAVMEYTPTATATATASATASAIRTSSLTEPTMKLTGHKGSVYALSYDPAGENLCSASFDMTCLLWSHQGNNGHGCCENYNTLVGHKNAILDLQWSLDSNRVVTASADKTLGWYDANSGQRIKAFRGHTGIVNACDTPRVVGSPELVVSASDDGTACLWDARSKKQQITMSHDYPLTAVAYADDTHTVYTGGIDNLITAWDIRKVVGVDSSSSSSTAAAPVAADRKMAEKKFSCKGHTDTITSLSLHPKGTHLLSNSMDGTLRSWDIRPFCNKNRLHKTFQGATHNAEKGLLKCAWSPDGTMVTGGSADRIVHIWDELSAEELYYLPGHAGCVNAVVFHPKENVIASGSSDKSIYVGELGQ